MRPPGIFFRAMLLLFSVGAIVAGAATNSKPVVVRAVVATEGRIWVGQQVRLQVDVLGRDGWAQIKKVSDYSVEGALVLRVETQGTRLQERINGSSYTGQRYEVLVFPRREGVIRFPEVSLDIEIKQWGASADIAEQQMTAPSVSFRAEMPPGCEGISDLISTRNLNVRQEWEPEDTAALKEGDSLKRIITLEADGIPGAAIAPFSAMVPAGVEEYPDQPSVHNDISRGRLSGSRSEAVTYVFTQSGEVDFDELKFSWWDMGAGELRYETFPGRTVAVAVNPLIKVNRQEDESHSSFWRYIVLGLVAVGALSLWMGRAKVLSGCAMFHEHKQSSEVAYFKRFVKAAQGDDPGVCLKALMQWIDKIYPGNDSPGLSWFLNQYIEGCDHQPAVELLERVSSGQADAWSCRAVVLCMKKGRSNWIAANKRRRRIASVLPELNPASETEA